MINFKQLTDTVAQDTSIPAGQVRKVASAILEKFKHLIESEESFRSPFITLKTVTLEACEAEGDKPSLPERNIARMKITTKEEKKEDRSDS